MRSVAILADDLTGALDTAAPFATRSVPVRVAWRRGSVPDGMPFSFDTESRQVSARVAAHRVRSCLPKLREAEISFKKVDSLIRGNTLAEVAACARAKDFGSLVIAPAFPGEARVTLRGRQIAAAREGAEAVEVDLAGALSRRRIAHRVVGRGDPLPVRGVMICDAETDADLSRIAAARERLEPPVLWCGSAGLARALGAPRDGPADAVPGPRLFVVGSRHPVAIGQANRLQARLGAAAAVIREGAGIAAAVATAARAAADGRSGALLFALPPLDPSAARAVMVDALMQLAGAPPPGVLVVVGGDTLFRMCTALGAWHLEAAGEWCPGVPVARIAGGYWNGVRLISKSGAFGDGDLLVRILDKAAECGSG